MKIVELILDENELNPTGVYAISLVNEPAIETNFVAMSKHKPQYTFAKAGEKHILTGPAMIPEKNITRYDENGNEYQVYVSAETIEKVSRNFMKNFNQKNITFEHSDFADGVFVTEQWVVNNPKNDKSNELGFDVPKGTWMMSMYVENLEIWNKVKDGIVKGFSIEGFFAENLIKASKEDDIVSEIELIINENLNK